MKETFLLNDINDLQNTPAIFEIRCKVNDKRFIRFTSHPQSRIKSILKRIKKKGNYRLSPDLAKDLINFGSDSFEVSILESENDKEIGLKKSQEYASKNDVELRYNFKDKE